MDSLCIIQDSAEDKEKALSRMADIYKKAFITISAASADNRYEGFIHKKAWSIGTGVGKDPFYMPYKCPNGVRGVVRLSEEALYHIHFGSTRARAWTLQEHVLSRRLLIYGSRMIWRCNSAQLSNGGTQDWSFEPEHSRKRVFSQITSFPAFDVEHNSIQGQELHQTWYSLVNDYTRRKLTYPSDKLPAIAGLAQEMARLTCDVYLAGLWKSTLARDLMWSLHSSTNYQQSPEWRAPSWSWASVDNAVRYGRIDSDAIPLAEVIKCTVQPTSEKLPYGEVTGGSLEIRSFLFVIEKAQIQSALEKERLGTAPPDKKKVAWNWSHWSKQLLESALNNAAASENQAPEPEPPERAYALALFQGSRAKTLVADLGNNQWRSWMSFSGLLLEQTGDGHYRRIGAFFDQDHR